MVKNNWGYSGYKTQKLILSEEWTDGITYLLHVDTDSQKLKSDQNLFGSAWSKMCVTNLVLGL